MAFGISLPAPVPTYTQRVTLDGVDYRLRMEWNSRSGWYIGLSDIVDDSPVFSPVRVRVGWDFLYGITDARRPPGMLWAWDSSGAMLPPGYQDLGPGRRVQLIYVPVDEL